MTMKSMLLYERSDTMNGGKNWQHSMLF